MLLCQLYITFIISKKALLKKVNKLYRKNVNTITDTSVKEIIVDIMNNKKKINIKKKFTAAFSFYKKYKDK